MSNCEVCKRVVGRNGRIDGCDLPIKLNKAITDYAKAEKAVEDLKKRKNPIVWRLWYARLVHAKLGLLMGNIRDLEKDVEACWAVR